MPLPDCPQGYVRCPYEKSHVILIEKIQFHLARCKYVNKNAPVVNCPYNTTHLVPAPEINNHVLYLCPDKKKVDTFICGSEPLFPVQNLDNIKSTENWDGEEHPTYDATKHYEDKALLLLKQVVPPSERKQFKADQRKKHQQLADSSVQKDVVENSRVIRLPITTSKFAVDEEKNTKQQLKSIENQLDNVKLAEETVPVRGVTEVLCSKNKNVEEVKQAQKSGDGFEIPRYSKRKNRAKKQAKK